MPRTPNFHRWTEAEGGQFMCSTCGALAQKGTPEYVAECPALAAPRGSVTLPAGRTGGLFAPYEVTLYTREPRAARNRRR